MAKFKINLIPGEERSRLDLSLWAKRLKTLAVSLLAVFTGLSGLVFLQYFRLRNDTETVNAKIIQAEKSILGLQLREQDLSKLKNRLQLAQKIMGLPVSYTHLRAHETVLDLVCRLLLEKKNKKKTKRKKQR